MARYRKKPVVIDAWEAGTIIYLAQNNPSALPEELRDAAPKWRFGIDYAIVPTLEGEYRAHQDDMIIRGVKGEFYPCKPDIFDATYELAE